MLILPPYLRAGIASGGGSSSGFTAESGFTVIASSFEHDQAMTITRSSGSWASRTYGASPWLYDEGDVAYHNGTAIDPLTGIGDGDLIPVTGNPNQPWLQYGQASHRIRVAESSGARTPPNSRTNKWVYSATGAADMKTELNNPNWPSAWNSGTQNNQQIYASWWFRMKSAYTSGTAFQGKYCRYNASDGTGIGSHQFNPDSINTSGQTMFGAGPPSLASTWYRLELYIDLDLNVLDAYSRYRYFRQVESTGTTKGPFEYRSDDPYNASTAPEGYLYTLNGTGNVPFTAAWSDVTLGHIGYDGQSGDVHGGQEHDIANAYVDANWERFEISDSATWSLAPNDYGSTSTGTPRELQGRWSRDSDTQCTVYINQGQFASLSGKYLWYVDNCKTATLIGQFD